MLLVTQNVAFDMDIVEAQSRQIGSNQITNYNENSLLAIIIVKNRKTPQVQNF